MAKRSCFLTAVWILTMPTSATAHTYSASSLKTATPVVCSVTAFNPVSELAKTTCRAGGKGIPSLSHYVVISSDADGYSCGSATVTSKTGKLTGVVPGAAKVAGTIRALPTRGKYTRIKSAFKKFSLALSGDVVGYLSTEPALLARP